MGEARQSCSVSKCPTGVEIRRWKSGKESIRIRFYYQAIECRETLNLKVTKSNIKYAERLRAEILNRIARHDFCYAEYFPQSNLVARFGNTPSDVSINALLDEFLEQAKKSKEHSTYIGYEKICRAHLYPQFGHVMIRSLTPAMLRQWISGLEVTTKTISNILLPLRAIIGRALNDEIIDSDPFDKIVISQLADRRTRQSNFVVDPFSVQEINQILAGAHHDQIRHLFQFAFFTGLRTSELIGLEWDDIDWDEKRIHVVRAVVKKQIKDPKTKAGERQVKLLPPALEALEGQLSYTSETRWSNFLQSTDRCTLGNGSSNSAHGVDPSFKKVRGALPESVSNKAHVCVDDVITW